MHLAGTLGPCPTCGTWLLAPALVQPPMPPQLAPSALQPEPARIQQRRKRGHLHADTTVDYEPIGRPETLRTLIIIGVALLVLSFGPAAAWCMKGRTSR